MANPTVLTIKAAPETSFSPRSEPISNNNNNTNNTFGSEENGGAGGLNDSRLGRRKSICIVQEKPVSMATRLKLKGVHVPLWSIMLIIPFLALVVVGIVALVLSYQRSQTTIDDISRSYRSLACTVVENKVLALIGSMSSTVTHLAEYVRTSSISATNPYPEDVRKALFYGFQSNPSLTSLYIGLNSMESLQIGRNSMGSSSFEWYLSNSHTGSPANTSIPGYYINVNHASSWEDSVWLNGMTNLTTTTTVFDATAMPWFQKAATETTLVLPPIYSSSINTGALELSQPIAYAVRYGSDTKVAAVVGAELALVHFDKFLSSFMGELMEKTIVFLVEKTTGYLLASSVSSERPLTSATSTSSPTRVLAASARDPTLRSIAGAVLNSLGGGWDVIGTDRNYTISTSEHLINVRAISMPAKGTEWVLVVATDKGVWMSTVDSGIKVTTGIVVGIIVGFTLLLIVISWLVTSPLRRVIRDITFLSSMDVDRVPVMVSNSKFTEIAMLVQSINALTAHLREYRKFLPDMLFEDDDALATEPSMTEPSELSDLLPAQQRSGPSFVPSNPAHQGSDMANATPDSPQHMARNPTATQSRCATLLCIEVANFDTAAFNMPFEEMRALHSQYINIVHESITKHRGMMDKVLGDRIFAVWNVPRRCAQSELHAVKCGMEVIHEFNNTLGTSSAQSPHQSQVVAPDPASVASSPPPPDITAGAMRLRCGIASSLVRYGILGNDVVRFFGVIGQATGLAAVLEKVGCKVLNVDILVSENVARHVDCHVLCLPVGVLRLPAEMIMPCYRPVEEIRADPSHAGEWMYTLRSNEASGDKLRTLFAQYCQSVREGKAMNAPPPSTPGDLFTAESNLKNTIARFPSGLEVQYMF